MKEKIRKSYNIYSGISAFRREKQEDYEFWDNLGCIVGPVYKPKSKEKRREARKGRWFTVLAHL